MICENPPRRHRLHSRPARPFVLGALALIVAAGVLANPSAAQTSASSNVEEQFWPEMDVYIKLNELARLYAIATYTFAENDASDNEQYGLNIDLFVKRPPAFPRLRGAGALAEHRHQPVQLRMGYRYSRSPDTPTVSVQNRLLAELTLRATPHAFSLSDRNGIDARWTDGEYSARYRNRIYLEVPAKLKGYGFTPYGNAEWFYSITDNEWTSVRYEVGAQLPVVSHFTVELYGGWQTYWHSTSPTVRGPGVNLVFSW